MELYTLGFTNDYRPNAMLLEPQLQHTVTGIATQMLLHQIFDFEKWFSSLAFRLRVNIPLL